MRLGLYGGSFDPIHYGHILPVVAAADQLDLDRVLYLPTANPPHKPDVSFAPPLRRFGMVELALLEDDRLQVSGFELASGPSYTIDTVEHFRAQGPDDSLFLLLGTDSLAQIESWRRWSDLLDAVCLVALRRPGWTRDQALAALSPTTRGRLTSDRLTFIDNEPVDLSATAIRARLAAGESPPTDWAPTAVVDYVRKYRLYS